MDPALPVCDAAGACVECVMTKDCAANQACDTVKHECIAAPPSCSSNADCGGALPACDTVQGVCVACTSDSFCTNTSLPVCDVAREVCVECNADGDCTDPAKPACLVSAHRCTDCSANVPCPTGKTCDLATGQCQ